MVRGRGKVDQGRFRGCGMRRPDEFYLLGLLISSSYLHLTYHFLATGSYSGPSNHLFCE